MEIITVNMLFDATMMCKLLIVSQSLKGDFKTIQQRSRTGVANNMASTVDFAEIFNAVGLVCIAGLLHILVIT